jgi:hypothetical protein
MQLNACPHFSSVLLWDLCAVRPSRSTRLPVEEILLPSFVFVLQSVRLTCILSVSTMRLPFYVQ